MGLNRKPGDPAGSVGSFVGALSPGMETRQGPAQPWKQLMAFGLKKTLGLPENHFLAISFLGMGSGKNIRRGVEV